MTPSTKKAAIQSLIIAALGITIGFLGELMPDSLKSKLAHFATETLGVSTIFLWVSLVILIVSALLIFVWREAIKNEVSNPSSTIETDKNNRNTVNQYGEKSTYVEKNEGGITIN